MSHLTPNDETRGDDMLYVLGDSGEPPLFRTVAGEWTPNIDDAEHMTIEDAVDKQAELIDDPRPIIVCEVPKMHEALYADMDRRFDELQERLREHDVFLEYAIGEGDETAWTITFERAGVAVVLKLESPDAFEVMDT
jgi:hypothetical protein